MDADVLGDLVGGSCRNDAVAYRHLDEPARSHTYDSFCTSTWQTANLLRFYGVHEGSAVGIVDAPKAPDDERTTTAERRPGTPIPEVLFALFGTAMQGGVVTFDPNVRAFEGGALLCPATWAEDVQVGEGCSVLAYGGPPTDPKVVHFEAEVWSETPIEPPETIDPDAPVLATHAGTYTHAELLTRARSFVDEVGLTAGDAVSIEAPLTHPGTVVGGIVAPLLTGGTLLVGSGDPTLTIGARDVSPEAVIRYGSDARDSRA